MPNANQGNPSRSLVTVGETMGLFVTPSFGKLRHHKSLDVRIGGAESNVAISASRLGATATWIGRVGSDPIGELVTSTIASEGVEVLAIVDAGPTSLMIKERRNAVQTEVTYFRRDGPGARLSAEDIDEEAIRSAGVLHVTGITAALSGSAESAVRAAMETAKCANTPVSFDVNYRSSLWSASDAQPVLRDLVRLSDILFVGDDEIEILLEKAGEPDTDARTLLSWGPSEVLVKRGARGAVLATHDSVFSSPGVAVPVVDTVGAGDAFAGGYLTERLAGEDLAQRLTTATHCGAFAVMGPGDWESSPTRQDLAGFSGAPRVAR